MSGPERQPPDDTLLDDFLAGRSEVSKAYRAATPDVAPPELDARILQLAAQPAAAPAAASAPSASARRWRRARWPVAIAATFVLSFSMLVAVREDRAAQEAALIVAEQPDPAPSLQMTEPEALEEFAAEPPPAAQIAAPAEVAPRKPASAPPPPPRPEPARPQRDGPSFAAAPPEPVGTGSAMPAPPPAVSSAPAVAGGAASAPQAAAEARMEYEQARRSEQKRKAESREMMADQALAEKQRMTQARGEAVARAFLQRPGVHRLAPHGRVLESSEMLVRSGLRQAGGDCATPEAPVPAGADASADREEWVELPVAIDPERCELLVERGVVRD